MLSVTISSLEKKFQRFPTHAQVREFFLVELIFYIFSPEARIGFPGLIILIFFFSKRIVTESVSVPIPPFSLPPSPLHSLAMHFVGSSHFEQHYGDGQNSYGEQHT